MTQHLTEHQAHHHGAHDRELTHVGMLDLDAEVVGHLNDLTAWAAGHVSGAPRVVVDVGAGTGTGTLALARRFGAARLVAVDSSAEMLDHLRTAALREGIGDRVRVVQADLDVAWPDVGPFDLAWAAASMHHVKDPGRVYADLHAALEPGGLLVVLEQDGMPRFLPHDLGLGRPGLEDRCRALSAHDPWSHYPDWTQHLERAGFAVLEQRTFTYERHPADDDARSGAARYAHAVFGRVRSGLADRLDAEDLATLDVLVAADGPESLLQRGDLTVRSTRTVWAARRG